MAEKNNTTPQETESGITKKMAEIIIASETSSRRFEAFCADLFSDVDGSEYVMTSRTWDLGRDAVDDSVRSGKRPPILMCSLRRNVAAKAKADITRVLEKVSPQTIRFCSNQRLSDAAEHEIEGQIRNICQTAKTVRVTGVDKIVQHSVRYPAHLRRWYVGELADLKLSLSVDEDTFEDVKISGMRIALTTQLHDDAIELRDDICENLILSALANGNEQSLPLIAKWVSDGLHLPRNVHPEYLHRALGTLGELRRITRVRQSYRITPDGVDELNRKTLEGSENLFEGKRLIRELMGNLSGEELTPQEVSQIWNTVQDAVANMFMANGIQIIDAIASMAGGESAIADHPDLYGLLRKIGDQISALEIRGVRASQIGQAFVDMFKEQDSGGFRWLTRLCAVYVGVCSLGLEPTAQQQVLERLREIELLLDTDVVLSFVCEGEPNHEVIQNVVRLWRRIGGNIYASESVLSEAAHHAWISRQDYLNTWRSMYNMSDFDAGHLIQNAFVRGFRAVNKAAGKYNPKLWDIYISQFRGQAPDDYAPLVAVLGDDGIQPISEEICESALADEAAKRVLALKLGDQVSPESDDVPKKLKDKSKRDGVLVALLDAHRTAMKQLNRTAVIISSSPVLRSSCESYRSRLGRPDPVMPIGAVGYLLAMAPGVRMGLGALRGILFDTGFAKRVGLLEELALRIVHQTEQYRVPWSKRGALGRQMRNQITELAIQKGSTREQVQEQLLHPTNDLAREELTQAVAAAVDKISLSSIERRLLDDNARLRQELDQLRRRFSNNTAKG